MRSAVARTLCCAGVLALTLSACGSVQPQSAGTGGLVAATSSAAPAPTASNDTGLDVTDAWVKAIQDTNGESMTAVFGTLINTTGSDRVVVSATTDASPLTELHEVVMLDGAMKMRPVDSGFPVPAGGEVTLEPGGLHVMVMDVSEDIEPGDQVDVTMTLDDGSSFVFTALAKEFAGGNEEYVPGD